MKPSSGRIISLICLGGTFALYLITLAPTVQGFDSAELTVGARALGFVHAPGYPLYMLLGHGFSWLPVGDVGLRLNLMSAIFGSLSAWILYWILRQDLDDPLLPLPAVLLFATAPVFWSQALRAEVYTLHTFLMLSVLLLWRRAHLLDRPGWYLFCFVLLGLGMGNHPTTALLWAAVLIGLVWDRPQFRRFGLLGTAVGLAVAGVLYLYFPVRSAAQPAVDYLGTYFDADLTSPEGLWWLFSAQMFQHAFRLEGGPVQIVNEIVRFGVLLWDSFLGIGVILGAWGWWRLRNVDRSWNRLLSMYLLLNLFFYTFYHVVDKEVMFAPAYAVWCIWIAHGIKGMADWITLQVSQLTAQTARTFTMSVVLFVVGMGVALNWPAVSLHGNRKAYDFAAQLLAEVEPSALVVNGWVTASVLDYLLLVEGRRPDVQSFNLDFYSLSLQARHGSLASGPAQADWHRWLEKHISERPICFIEPLPAVPEDYQWTRIGLCWKLLTVP